MVGLIVKAEEGACRKLAERLSGCTHVSIHSVQNSQITLLLDTEDIHIIARSSCEIQAMEGVISVYPIFSADLLQI